MLAITWGTKNEGSFVRLARLARNTAQTAKFLLVQINSKTQASQLEMCILTYRRHWRMSTHPVLVSWTWFTSNNARAPHWFVGNAPLCACGSLMLQMALFSDYWGRSTVVTCGKKETIARYPCTPPAKLETFCEKSNASTASGKEIAGLKKKKKKMKNMIMMTRKSRNHVRANSLVGNWGHVGSLGAYV